MAANPDRGSEVIRSALSAHAKKSLNIAVVAKDLRVTSDLLLGFIDGKKTLSADAMRTLAALLFHNYAEYDAEHDLLRPAYREPAKVIGVARPPAKTMTSLPLKPMGPPPLYSTPHAERRTEAGRRQAYWLELTHGQWFHRKRDAQNQR
jgi:hypothetical protein